MTDVYRYPNKSKATINQEDIKKLDEEIESINDTLKKMKSIVLSHNDLIKSEAEAMSKLVKMLYPNNKEVNK